jgi:hypothetical protein
MNLAGLFRTLAIVGLLSGCATTEITSSWKAPEAKPLAVGSKVAVLVLVASPGQRRAAEDRLARNIKNATPAYRLFNDEEVTDRQLVRERLQQQGFTYCVVLQVQGVVIENQVRVTPTVHRNLNMWDDGSVMWTDPNYTNTKVFASTRLYAVADGNLLWEAQTKTFNPDKAEELVDDIAKAARERLERDGLVAATN